MPGLNLSPSLSPANTALVVAGVTVMVIHERGDICHLVLLQPRDRSSFSFICPLGLQRSPLIVSVIEDWHRSVQYQAAKNKSNWLLASVTSWLVAMACLAATTLRRADRAALGW